MKLLGITGGPIPIYAARVLVACLSGLALFSFDRWLKQLEFEPWARFFGIAFFAFHPALVFWGVTTLTDDLALDAMMMVLPWVFQSPASFRSGLLMGIPFLIRFQTIALMPGFALFLLLQKTKFRDWLCFGLGYLCVVAVFGAVDWLTWGSPFASVVNQLGKGVKISENWGVTPIYQYFIFLFENLGCATLLGVGFAFIMSLFTRRRVLWSFVSLPAISFFLIHSLIGHKEARFILPIYFSFVIWIVLAVEVLSVQWSVKNRFSGLLLGGLTLICAILSFWKVTDTDLYLTWGNTFSLEAKIREDGQLLNPQVQHCVLTLEYHWSWSRGQLMQATAFDFIDLDPSTLATRQASPCPYVMLRDSAKNNFLSHAPEKWTEIAREQKSQFVLLKQDR